MGGWQSVVLSSEVATQTEAEEEVPVSGRASAGAARRKSSTRAVAKEYPQEILRYSPGEIQDMILLYKDRQSSIDRSSIRGVTAKKDLYNNLDKHNYTVSPRPRLDPSSLHRQNHPKGYLTKITSDWQARHDEELTVQKGTMVKVLRNHKDGRYEVYTAGGFGLVPGRILAYIQYEPDVTNTTVTNEG